MNANEHFALTNAEYNKPQIYYKWLFLRLFCICHCNWQ